jgi:hypothetical protein
MEAEYRPTVQQEREKMREDGIDDREYTDKQIEHMIENGF